MPREPPLLTLAVHGLLGRNLHDRTLRTTSLDVVRRCWSSCIDGHSSRLDLRAHCRSTKQITWHWSGRLSLRLQFVLRDWMARNDLAVSCGDYTIEHPRYHTQGYKPFLLSEAFADLLLFAFHSTCKCYCDNCELDLQFHGCDGYPRCFQQHWL